jgi:exodeoxyribonuclease V alpha subunit
MRFHNTALDLLGGIINVRYDDRTATYFTENISELELAYAITVHKSQGSEFDCVVLPMVDIPQQLMYRNLLYTAITRAKKLLVIVGSEYVFCKMAENDRKTLRYTMLKEFINEKYDI